MQSNEQYHADRTRLSSSVLKQILKDPDKFIKTWVNGVYEKQESKSYLDEGSLVHTLVLEPHKVQEEYAFWEGLRKAGKGYEFFCEQNIGKKILSAPQKLRAEELLAAVGRRPELLAMCQGGVAESTILGDVAGVAMKIRPDYINSDKGYIVDLKTTSYPADVDIFRQTIQQYDYDLSAALYVMVAEQVYCKPFEFYFAPISKPDKVADIYLASSETMDSGRLKVMAAVVQYKKLKANNWQIENKGNKYESENYEILKV